MITAQQAYDLSKAAFERVERTRADYLMAKLEQFVSAATARGEYHVEVPFDDYNLGVFHAQLRELGYDFDTKGRGASCRLSVHWGGAR